MYGESFDRNKNIEYILRVIDSIMSIIQRVSSLFVILDLTVIKCNMLVKSFYSIRFMISHLDEINSVTRG